ncbi:MAG: hypothetical protein JW938_01205 [Candidatus Omnitrophica bacterium]|nr:hypothetical protein [Candidatus Omnitrophota bacterium]
MTSIVQATGLNVAPTLIEQSLEPGKVQHGIYRVKNTTDVTMQIVVQPEDWMVRLFGVEGELDVSDWLVVAPSEFELAPGEEKDLSYTLTAPFRFTGEKVAQVFFEFKTERSLSMLSTRLGVIVYMMAKGAEKVDAAISNVGVSYKPPKSTEDKALYRVYFDVKNHGNVHIRPFGNIVIRDPNDRSIVKAIELLPSKGIYPGKEDNIIFTQFDSSLEPGKYEATVNIDIGQLYGLDKRYNITVPFEVKNEEAIKEDQ